jgi:hypothetical protein
VRYRTTVTETPSGTCIGRFSFTDLPAGTYILAVGSTPGNPVATRTVTVQPSQQLGNVAVVVPT